MFSVLSASAYELSESQTDGDVRFLYWPELQLDQPESFQQLDDAIDHLFGYDWLLIKNEQAADHFLARLEENHSADELDQLRVLAIGEVAADRLARSQIHVDVSLERFPIPNPVVALETYASEIAGLNLLIPSAGLISERFEEQLRERGVRVDNAVAYRTVAEKARVVEMNALLIGGGVDSITFASPAEIDQFAQLIDSDDLRLVLAGVLVACGGNETATAIQRFGLSPAVVAPSDNRDDLIAALRPFA